MATLIRTTDGASYAVNETIGEICSRINESKVDYIIVSGVVYKRIMIVIKNIASMVDA